MGRLFLFICMLFLTCHYFINTTTHHAKGENELQLNPQLLRESFHILYAFPSGELLQSWKSKTKVYKLHLRLFQLFSAVHTPMSNGARCHVR